MVGSCFFFSFLSPCICIRTGKNDFVNFALETKSIKGFQDNAKAFFLVSAGDFIVKVQVDLISKSRVEYRSAHMSCTSTIPSSYLLPELLAGFGGFHPDIYFHSIQTDSEGAIHRVLDGTVDLALVGQNTGDESCVFIPFCQDTLVIATPVTEHYLKFKEDPVDFKQFLEDPIIIREKGSGTKKEMDLFLEKIGITPSDLNVIARMNDLESIKKSIVNGLGISILSARSAVDLEKTKQILLFPLEESVHKRSFYIVYSKNRILKPHVRQFMHYVRDFYQEI